VGRWNPSSFGNDAALDLLLRLEELADAEALRAELIRPLTAYHEFEMKRVKKTNKTVFTEERLEELLAAYLEEDRPHLREKLSPSLGKELLDDGAYEASEAIAAIEVMYAKLSGDFSNVHEDGHFLKDVEIFLTRQDTEMASDAAREILKNSALVKASGSAWRKNLLKVQARIAGVAV
jgi:hypothetical protein